MRYEVHRLEHGASFASAFNARSAFDAVVVDTMALRTADKEVCVAPYVAAVSLALLLNDTNEQERVYA